MESIYFKNYKRISLFTTKEVKTLDKRGLYISMRKRESRGNHLLQKDLLIDKDACEQKKDKFGNKKCPKKLIFIEGPVVSGKTGGLMPV